MLTTKSICSDCETSTAVCSEDRGWKRLTSTKANSLGDNPAAFWNPSTVARRSSGPERKGRDVCVCGCLWLPVYMCVVVTRPQRSQSVWLFNLSLHGTMWLFFNWLTDVDADSQRSRRWPAAREARKPSDKTLHGFWQLPSPFPLPLYLSPWSRTQWVFCLRWIYG